VPALTPTAKAALEIAILRDLRVGQSTADSTAGRLKTDLQTTQQLLAGLVTDGLVETTTIAQTLTAYRITQTGLIAIA
jgi:hypothetical protein